MNEMSDPANNNLSTSPTCVSAGLDGPSLPPTSTVILPPTSETHCKTLQDESIQLVSTPSWTVVPPSAKSLRTRNPIRAIVDPIVSTIQSGTDRGDGKDHISLALGDPTASGNLPPCPVAIKSIVQSLQSPPHAAGYINACGLPAARQAIANFHGKHCHGDVLTLDHVIVASGCSGALELALTALLDEGSILLVPQPGFPLYQVIAESHGAQVVQYPLDPERNWECDFQQLRALVNNKLKGCDVRGIVINNPSNPTGAVFSKQHLQEIAQFCDEHCLPIIADEVYGDLTFGSHTFYPMAEIAWELGRNVPVITASGIGKQFLLPGWRVGWIVFQDNIVGSLQEVEKGAKRLAQVILGASHLAQSVVPPLLQHGDPAIQSWKTELRSVLESQAQFLCSRIAPCKGLEVLEPGGAMYTTVRLNIDLFDDAIKNDVDFTSLLLKEENLFVLPGSCFGFANVIRLVFCAPIPVLDEAANRIRLFCDRHTL